MRDAAFQNAEELLHRFFEQELPSPWPPLQLPADTIEQPQRRASRRGRLALAASVGFLLLGLGLASELSPNGSQQGTAKDTVLPAKAARPGAPIRHTAPGTTPADAPKPPDHDEGKPFTSPLSSLPR